MDRPWFLLITVSCHPTGKGQRRNRMGSGDMTRWTALTADPNSPSAVNYRACQMSRATATFTYSRTDLVRLLVEGKTVLDVGCVDHSFGLAVRPDWLHGIITKSAARVLGIDYDAEGIEEMKQAGYTVLQADITGDLTAVAKHGPFDVIVAGEVIEHVNSPQAILDAAATLLAPGGTLLITTPNPYAPWRVRNGQRGRTWENVDHVVYCFPSGIAEMADRAGLQLIQYGSVNITHRSPALWRVLRERVGALLRHEPSSPVWISPLDALVMKMRRGPMLQETAVYLLEARDRHGSRA